MRSLLPVAELHEYGLYCGACVSSLDNKRGLGKSALKDVKLGSARRGAGATCGGLDVESHHGARRAHGENRATCRGKAEDERWR